VKSSRAVRLNIELLKKEKQEAKACISKVQPSQSSLLQHLTIEEADVGG